MKKIILFLFVTLVASCSSIKVSYDYDKSADFNKYKTYSYTEDALKLGISELNRDRMLKAIDAELTARGLSKSDSPDAWIDLSVKSQEKTQATATNNNMGMYRGRYGYGGGYTTTSINYEQYVEGTLFITLIDKTTEKVAWQGRGTKTIDEDASPEKREKNINWAVKSIFEKYPVKPAKK